MVKVAKTSLFSYSVSPPYSGTKIKKICAKKLKMQLERRHLLILAPLRQVP